LTPHSEYRTRRTVTCTVIVIADTDFWDFCTLLVFRFSLIFIRQFLARELIPYLVVLLTVLLLLVVGTALFKKPRALSF